MAPGGSPGPDDHDLVVVGGGIAGLTCAWRVASAGGSVMLLEEEPVVGGCLRSEARDGFVVDLGPQTVRTADPDLLADFEALGLADTLVPAQPSGGRRFVLAGGRITALPDGPLAFLRTGLLSARGKARVVAEPLVPRAGRGDESVDGFFRRRLGAEVAERLVDPFVSGIHAGDPARLSMARSFPAVAAGERAHGSLLRWALATGREKRRATGRRRREAEGNDRPRVLGFAGGLGAWPEALAAALGPRVHTGVRVTEVARDAGAWVVRGAGGEVRARHVVLATPAPAAADLLGSLAAQEIVGGLRAVEHAPVITVALGYAVSDLDAVRDGFGVLFPSGENRPVLGILWVSSIFSGRAPPDTFLTTTFLGGARRPEQIGLDDPQLVEIAHREHERFMGARGRPVLARVWRWPAALPQHVLSGPDAEELALRAEAALPGLRLAGSYRTGGASVPACWRRGRDAADGVLASLGAVGRPF